MGILLCEQNFRDVWNRNESVRAEIGQILHTDTHTHTTAAKLVVRIHYLQSRYCAFVHSNARMAEQIVGANSVYY